MGYGEAKQALFEISWEHFAVAREKREKLAADPGTIEDILRAGSRAAPAKQGGRRYSNRPAHPMPACGLRSRRGNGPVTGRGMVYSAAAVGQIPR